MLNPTVPKAEKVSNTNLDMSTISIEDNFGVNPIDRPPKQHDHFLPNYFS